MSKTHRVRAYQRGRICAHDGCETILSVYNPSAYCGAHAEQARGKRRRGELHPVRDVACEHCGAIFETRNTHRRYCSDRCRMAAFARRKRAAQRAQTRLALVGAEAGTPAVTASPALAEMARDAA